MENIIDRNLKFISESKNIILLLIGRFISNTGTWLHTSAALLFIMSLFTKIEAPKYMSTYNILIQLPLLLMCPFSGVIIDRINKKTILIYSDIIRGTLISVLAYFIFIDFSPIICLFTISVIKSMFDSFDNPTIDASIPFIVSENNLVRVNAINSTLSNISKMTGFAFAGVSLYYWGFRGVLVIDAISFFLCAIIIKLIDIPHNRNHIGDTSKNAVSIFLKDLKSGLVYIKNEKLVKILLFYALFVNFLFGSLELILTYISKYDLKLNDIKISTIAASFAFGSLLGGICMFFAPIILKNIKNYSIFKLSLYMYSIIFVLFSMPIFLFSMKKLSSIDTYSVLLILTFLFMMFLAIIDAVLLTTFQTRIKDEYKGRVFGLLETLFLTSIPLSYFIYGLILSLGKIDCEYIIFISGMLTLFATIVLFKNEDLKSAMNNVIA